jgi:hypothetical protein
MHSENKHQLSAFGWLVLLVACLVVGMTGTFQELRKLTESAPGKSNQFDVTERQSALQAADQLLAASAHFAGERGLSLAALSGAQAIGATAMAAIRERRTLADEALGRAYQHLLAIRRSLVRERIVSRIELAHGRVVSLRSGVDLEAIKPADQGTQLTLQSLEIPTALIGAMAELLRAIHSELRSSDRAISDWLEVQRLTWEMAEYAGRERAQIAAFLAKADRATRTRLVFADRHHHQAVFAWKQMQLTLSRLSPPQDLIDQTKVIEQRYFADQEQVRRAVVGASHGSPMRVLPLPKWFEGATLAIDAMIEFGRKAGSLAAEQSISNS